MSDAAVHEICETFLKATTGLGSALGGLLCVVVSIWFCLGCPWPGRRE